MSVWRRRTRADQIEFDMLPMLADGDAFDTFLKNAAHRLVELRRIEEDRERGVAAGRIVSILRDRETPDPYAEVHATARMLDRLFQRDGETWLDEIRDLAEEIENPEVIREPTGLRVRFLNLQPKDSAPGS